MSADDQLGRLRVRARRSARAQVRGRVRLSVSDRESPWFTVRSGTQRARRRASTPSGLGAVVNSRMTAADLYRLSGGLLS